jgi:hypothetical protein
MENFYQNLEKNTIQFEDNIIKVIAYCELIPYYKCDCPILSSVKEFGNEAKFKKEFFL